MTSLSVQNAALAVGVNISDITPLPLKSTPKDSVGVRRELTESNECAREVLSPSRDIRPTEKSFGTIIKGVGKALYWDPTSFLRPTSFDSIACSNMKVR